jgi:hypothetical protein
VKENILRGKKKKKAHSEWGKKTKKMHILHGGKKKSEHKLYMEERASKNARGSNVMRQL